MVPGAGIPRGVTFGLSDRWRENSKNFEFVFS